MNKKEFDVIVIGAGSGLRISSKSAELGLKTALIDEGPFGGTCLNRGCIPSKILIHVADVVENIKNSKMFGIESKINKIDWDKIQKRVKSIVNSAAKGIEDGNKEDKNITIYKKRAEFVDSKTIKVGNELIIGKKIFICAGGRPFIPNIKGLEKVNYITSDEALFLKKLPKKMAILGGGYISAELCHLFSSLGVDVTIIYRGNKLLKHEDGEVSEKYTEIAFKKYNLMLDTDVVEVNKKGKNIIIKVQEKNKIKNLIVDSLLITTGRIPNTDILKIENSEIEINKNGFIKVNEYLETNVENVFAIGDIVGKYSFKHSANLEADICVQNAFGDKKIVDYKAMPHAIFTSPQIAGVGYTEQELKERKIKYLVGKYQYIDTGMGTALNDEDGFVKILVDAETRKILGCHIIGTDASTLIHEIIVAVKNDLTVDQVASTVHIHPALSEVIQRACLSVGNDKESGL